MIKKFTYGIITLLLVSCGVDHTDFSGDWIDKKNESDRMIIKRNGDNYIVENNEKKYPAQVKEGLLEISTELPIKATIDENDILIINGAEYIRIKKATKPKFTGNWKSVAEGPYGFCKLYIDTKSKKVLIKTIDLSCEHFAYDILYPKYNNGEIKLTRKQYNELGGSDNFEGKIILISDNEIEINYKDNYPNSQKFIRE